MVVGHKQSPLDPTYRENARVFEVWIKLELDQDTLEKLRRLILQPVDVTIGIGSGNPTERLAEGRS